MAGKKLSDRGASVQQVRVEIGIVFQNFNLFPHLTVARNCTLVPMQVHKVIHSKAMENARRYLSQTHMVEQAEKYLAQLSGDQQQRVAMARTLCMGLKVMSFNKPTFALDPELVKEVLDTMVCLARDGMTMICVTHEMGFAKQVADRVVFMAAGDLREDAPPAQFFDDSQHPHARAFLRKIFR